MKSLCSTILALLLTLSATSAFDLESITRQTIGGGAFLKGGDASSLSVVPGDQGTPLQLSFELSRRYELSDLDQVAGAFSLRHKRLLLAGGLAQLGDPDLYRELTGRLMFGVLMDSLAIGMHLSRRWLSFGNNYSGLDAHTIGGAASYRHRHWSLGLELDNLTRPRMTARDPGLSPRLTLLAQVDLHRQFTFMGRLAYEYPHGHDFGLGQEVRLSKKTALRWGFSTRPLKYGAGLRVEWRQMHLEVATNYHPTLGFSTGSSLGLSLGQR